MENLENFAISTIVPYNDRPITPLQIRQNKEICHGQEIEEQPAFTVRALWDSGATDCFINENLARKRLPKNQFVAPMPENSTLFSMLI
jgi:hypothetical protein